MSRRTCATKPRQQEDSEAQFRGIRPEVFYEKGVLRTFAKFTGKHLCQSLLCNRVASLWHKCFPANFAKFLRTPFLTGHIQWLLLVISVQTNLKYTNGIMSLNRHDFDLTSLWCKFDFDRIWLTKGLCSTNLDMRRLSAFNLFETNLKAIGGITSPGIPWKRCSWKFRNIHRKTPTLESLFNKVAALQACNFIKKRLQHMCFPVNITKFLRTPILKNIRKRLLLTSA